MSFAKLYGVGDGQILVKIDEAEDGAPEVRFYFQPPGLGVCSMALKFQDSYDGWDKAEAAFEAVTEDSARAAVEKQLALLI